MTDSFYELKQALVLASPLHCFEDAFYRSGLEGLDQLDMDFIVKCRKLLPAILKDFESLNEENEVLEQDVLELEGENEELKERISIMTENRGPYEGWDS